MGIFALGLNHQTAPIGYREKVAAAVQNIETVNETLKIEHRVSEIVTLSTCNRVEFYGVVRDGIKIDVLFQWLAERGVEPEQAYFYIYEGEAVVRHLFRVVSSLDSMILGENQIIAQVRTAFQIAEKTKSVGGILRRLFERAFVVAKRVRNETRISEGAVSIGRAGVDLSVQVLGDVSGCTAMIVGAGEHGQIIAKNLKSQGVVDLFIANRTFERAADLAKELGGLPIQLSDISR